ncbi:hypothetical protein H0H92_006389, partial [Tricholoma furcatifolium]
MLPNYLKQNIISVSRSRDHWVQRHFVLLGDEKYPPYFVKYNQSRLEGESQTLNYLYALASNDPGAPCIPKLIEYFEVTEKPWDMNYLVMEYIPPPAVTLEVWIKAGISDEDKYDRMDFAIKKVTETISWLRSCPLPPNASVGSVGGGTICHRLWSDFKALLKFTSAAALERYINKALEMSGGDSPPVIAIADLPLQFCHSDVTCGNFLFDPETKKISLIDVDSISILPAPLFL